MIKIICVGSVKEKYYIDAIKKYQKRISKYHQLEIIEVEDFGNSDKITTLRKEKERILKHLNKKEELPLFPEKKLFYDQLDKAFPKGTPMYEENFDDFLEKNYGNVK